VQSSLKEDFSIDLEMPFGDPSLMPFANIRGSLKTDDELDLMLGCIDHETEVEQDDCLITPPINTRYSPGIRRRVLICSHYANLCQRPWSNTRPRSCRMTASSRRPSTPGTRPACVAGC